VAIPVGAYVKIILRYTFLGQLCENVMRYQTDGAAWLTADAAGGAEAWWNNTKDRWLAIAPADINIASYDSVLFSEDDPDGAYGEFAIPADEREGTRSTAGLGGVQTSFEAGGVRLTVATRATRPGQKRVPFIYDQDTAGNAFNTPYLDLLEDLASVWDTNLTLGAPVLTGGLKPVIGGTIVDGFPTVYQPVIGHVVNPNVTSQVSRKQGRGQ